MVCHKEETVLRAYEALIREAQRDQKFARRVKESAHRAVAFKKRWMKSDKRALIRHRTPASNPVRVEKLARQLWAFGEEIRLATLARTGKTSGKKQGRA